MKVLFVCKWNRFRSKIAEGYFNEMMLGSKHKVKSAGFIFNLAIGEETIKIINKGGISLVDLDTRGLDYELLDWADVIIIVADDVKDIFHDEYVLQKEVIEWNVKDVPESDEEKMLASIETIKGKVDEFVFKRLEKE